MDPLIGLTIDFTSETIELSERDDSAPRGGLGSQVLPVAEFLEDFNGEPNDGEQYLYLVRKEAELHPKVNRVENPYRLPEVEAVVSVDEEEEEETDKPTEQWRKAFVAQFTTLRTKMSNIPPRDSFPSKVFRPLPTSNNEADWKEYIYGTKTQSKPVPEPISNRNVEVEILSSLSLEEAKAAAIAALELDTPSQDSVDGEGNFSEGVEICSVSLLLEFSQLNIFNLIINFHEWILLREELELELLNFIPSTSLIPNSVRRKRKSTPITPKPITTSIIPKPKRKSLPTPHEIQWLLSLLSKLDSLLTSDDIANLRSLAKSLLRMSSSSYKASTRSTLVGGPRKTEEERKLEEMDAEVRGGIWMIVVVVCDIWGQKDLWEN